LDHAPYTRWICSLVPDCKGISRNHSKSKVINHIKPPAPTIHKSTITRGSIPIELTTPFKQSVLTSSPIYNEDTRSANAALLTELTTRNTLSTPAQTYAQCVVRREERSAVRNIIREEEHEKLKAAVTKRKADCGWETHFNNAGGP
jgi:hypothetical protein